MFILCINAMIWIMKAFRHSQSIEIVLPKPLCKELGWGFNTHFVVEPHGDKQAIITSLDDWLPKKDNQKEEKI